MKIKKCSRDDVLLKLLSKIIFLYLKGKKKNNWINIKGISEPYIAFIWKTNSEEMIIRLRKKIMKRTPTNAIHLNFKKKSTIIIIYYNGLG